MLQGTPAAHCLCHTRAASPELGTEDAPGGAITAVPGDVSPGAGHSCCVTPHGDTRDACSLCPISRVHSGVGGEPGDTWGQAFPGRDAQSGPCPAAGACQLLGGTRGCTGEAALQLCEGANPSNPPRRLAALIPTVMTHVWVCKRSRSASTRPRWWWLAQQGR